MACESPNLIEHDARYKGIEFKGKSPYAVELIDQWIFSNDDTKIGWHVPCGDCDPCKISRRYDRANRIMLEASCYERNVFVTLTYNDEHVGYNDLADNHFTQFQKDIRRVYGQAQYCKLSRRHWKKNVSTYTHTKFKFIQTGEYGDRRGRKHYHAIIFNLSFSDMYFTGYYSDKGNPIFSSKELEKLWGKGNVQCENITFDLALYLGKYITDGWEDEELAHPETGLIRKKPYSSASHGIGLTWLKKYYRSVLNAGKIMFRGPDGDIRETPISRYFKKKMATIWPIEYARYKRKQFIALKQKMEFIKQNKGDGMLASSIRAGELTKIIHKQRKLT